MPDKSVIQMSEKEHFGYVDELATIYQRLEESKRRTPMTHDEIAAHRTGFVSAFTAATRSIQRNGNCRFEDEHG